MKENDETFTIKVRMHKRWVPHFLGMLQRMQRLGEMGSSLLVKFYADGDGDYRPKFEWDIDVEPARPDKGDVYDAG